jgi:acyl-CoA synthetase (AMP-forming)/AMP-acid ligase II
MKLYNIIINDDEIDRSLDKFSSSLRSVNKIYNTNIRDTSRINENNDRHDPFDFPEELKKNVRDTANDNNKPCLAIIKPYIDNRNKNFVSEKSSHDVSYLSYKNAKMVLLQHRGWLQERIIKNHRDHLAKDIHAQQSIHRTSVISIAYLCWNSGDYLLSALSSTSISGGLIGPHKNLPNTKIMILPTILLNTRWSASEIVSILQCRHNEENVTTTTRSTSHKNISVSCCQHYTILIYDASMESIATEVVTSLNRDYHNHDCCRQYVTAVSLPIYTSHYVTSTVATSTPLSGSTAEFKSNYDKTNQQTKTCFHTVKTHENVAFIVFTSGTSGKIPKGVLLSHKAILVQSIAKLQPPCSYKSNTIVMGNTIPFFHVGGISSMLAVWIAKGCIAVPCSTRGTHNTNQGSFDPFQILQSISSTIYSIPNTLVVVPTMLYALQQVIEQRHSNVLKIYPTVQLILVGGQSLSSSLLTFIVQVFPNAKVVQTYACTEAASSLTFLQVLPPIYDRPSMTQPKDLRGDCVGKPPHFIRLVLVRTKANHVKSTGKVLLSSTDIVTEPYQVGTIATRGPHVMNGYWHQTCSCAYDEIGHTTTGSTITSNSSENSVDLWFVTNDLAYRDTNGLLYFYGRSSDTIRTGGETVQANEVEYVIAKHPLIQECCVFPLKNEQYGEIVSCALVLKLNIKVTSKTNDGVSDSYNQGWMKAEEIDDDKDMIKQWCIQHGLARYKQPRKVFRVHELPRNSSGKVMKYRLMDLFNPGSQTDDTCNPTQLHIGTSKL